MMKLLSFGARKSIQHSWKTARAPVFGPRSFLSTGSGPQKDDSDVPLEFFDERVEKEKVLFDVINSVTSGGGLRSLTSLKGHDMSWKSVIGDADSKDKPFKISDLQREEEIAYHAKRNALSAEDVLELDNEDFDESFAESVEVVDHLEELQEGTKGDIPPLTPIFKDDALLNTVSVSKELSEHLYNFGVSYESESEEADDPFPDRVFPIITPPMLNHHLEFVSNRDASSDEENQKERSSGYHAAEKTETPQQILDKFIPDTSRDKYDFDNQGARHCEGKKQRHGKKDILRCHKIDLDQLHFLDVNELSRFVSPDAEILPKKVTGLCSKCQRQVAKTIKRARNFGIMPHIGEFGVRQAKPIPGYSTKPFHDVVKDGPRVVSKTIT